jgi:hypothetical protein
MINLIPNQEKKKMVTDFYLRLFIVFFTVMGVSFLIASIAVVPYYFFSKEKFDFANEKLQAQMNVPLPRFDKETNDFIKEIDLKISLIEGAQNGKFLVSEKVIQKVLSKKTPDIKINRISYEETLAKGKVINIIGSATSREKLANFRAILQSDPDFAKVELPISNFIKGANTEFNLTIIPAI